MDFVVVILDGSNSIDETKAEDISIPDTIAR
jgi:hypothetical protein